MNLTSFRELYLTRLNETLKDLDSELNYIISWNSDIETDYDATKELHFNENDVFIVVDLLPSSSFGDDDSVFNTEIKIMAHQAYGARVQDVFTKFIGSVVNVKNYLDEYMMSESYTTPQLMSNFNEIDINYCSAFLVNGTVCFVKNVIDIEKVYLFAQWNKMIEFIVTTTADSVAQNFGNKNHTTTINKKILMKIDGKCIARNNIFCEIMKNWQFGKCDKNITIPLKIVYTDTTEIEKQMILTSVAYSSNATTIPSFSFSLLEKE